MSVGHAAWVCVPLIVRMLCDSDEFAAEVERSR